MAFSKGGIFVLAGIALLLVVCVVVAVVLTSKSDEVSSHLPDKPTPRPRGMKSYFQFEDMFSWKYDPQSASVSWISVSCLMACGPSREHYLHVFSPQTNTAVTRVEVTIADAARQDNEYAEIDRKQDLIIYNMETSKTKVALNGTLKTRLNVRYYWFSPDREWILLACNTTKLYRRSFFADYVLYNIKNRTTHQVVPPDPKEQIQLALWANNGSAVGFVQGNNVYWMKSAFDKPIQITNDGVPDKIFNGVPDWVYEEDVTHTNIAMWFSPDGKYLCFAHSNDTSVIWFPYMWYGPANKPYTTVKRIAYPKPGTPNPLVSIKLVDLHAITFNSSDIPKARVLQPPQEMLKGDFYYNDVVWATKSLVAINWSNRHQNVSTVTTCSAASGNCTEALRQAVSNGWIDTGTYKKWFSESGSYYLCKMPFSQGIKEGTYLHIGKVEIVEGQKAKVTNLTYGTWDVQVILAFDREREIVFFRSAETSPRERHVYSYDLKKNKKECLTCNLAATESGQCRFWSASFSWSGAWYLLACYGPGVPQYTMRSTKNDKVIEVQMNKLLEEKLANLSSPIIKRFTAPSAVKEYELNCLEIRPPDFDENKKYSVLFAVYGGPGSNKVDEMYRFGWEEFLVSNYDLIVVKLDARGTGYRGEKFKHEVYLQLGEVEAYDTISVGRYMQTKPYVDKDKLAIWGWSYGGFLSAYVLNRGPDVFKCALAVAPVFSWIYYDSAYTERYMGLPQENVQGYKKTSLIDKAAAFINSSFLIVHGSGDDNVHYQQTAQMVRSLTDAEVPFRIQYYTDKAHGLTGRHTRRHLYRLLTKFLVQSLNIPRTRRD